MCFARHNGWRKFDELSNKRVPKDEIVGVRKSIGKANQAVISTDDVEYFEKAFTMEREVKAGAFIEIFVIVVVPIQFVEFR